MELWEETEMEMVEEGDRDGDAEGGRCRRGLVGWDAKKTRVEREGGKEKIRCRCGRIQDRGDRRENKCSGQH